jgi:hypothetical protein
VNLPAYSPGFDLDGMAVMGSTMKETGFLTTNLDVQASILK